MNGFALTLTEWFRQHGRDLPWRHTRDPYAIWLSEIILQQTQVKQGLDYWLRFMQRWPTVEALASATEDEVLRQWQGLGYYSRARNLLFAARQVMEQGGFPQTIEGLKRLKGVGDYTAAAIGSIAFDLPAAVVDGNVYRVLARYFGIDTPINTTEGKKFFAALAQDQLQPAIGSDGTGAALYNQAIMDFGAIQCTPQSPQCDCCPLVEGCQAYRSGHIAQLPVKLKTLKVRERHLIYIYIRCQGQTAIHQRGAGDIWQGLWEPFLIEADGKTPSQNSLTPLMSGEMPNLEEIVNFKLQPSNFKCLRLLRQNVRHVLTHRILYADFYLLETSKQPKIPDDYIWVAEEELDRYALPRLVEHLLEMLHC